MAALPPSSPPITVGRFASGDRDYQNRKEVSSALNALASYRKAYAETPEDPDAAWRLAMSTYFVGLRLTIGSEEKILLFAEGREAGRAALKVRPNCAPCHFWTAINMALYGQEIGPFKTLSSLKEIREHLAATIRIDPSYAFAGAHRLLGVIDQKLPGILGGSNQDARANFEKAIQASPDEPLNYLFLAKLLKEELNDYAGAMLIARKGLGTIEPSSDRVESLEAREDLKKFLEGS